MAIDYSSVLFPVLGKYIKTINTFDGLFSTVDTGITDIETILEANSLNHLVESLYQSFEGDKRNIESWISQLIGEVRQVLTDEYLVLNELPISSSDIDSVLFAIIEDMVLQSETVNSASTLEVAAGDNYTAPLGSKDTIRIIFGVSGLALDSVTSPKTGASASSLYNNLRSELSFGKTSSELFFECVSAPSDGEERFILSPYLDPSGPYKSDNESLEPSSTFPFASSENLVSDGELDNFTNSVPNGWTVSGGTAGTDYDKYNVSFRGDHSLVIKDQAITISKFVSGMQPGKAYFITFRSSSSEVLATDHTNTKSPGDFDTYTITVTGPNKDGTNWTRTISTVINNPTLGLDWDSGRLLCVVPNEAKSVPVELSIKLTPWSGDWTLIDEIVVSPARYYGGIPFAVLRGQITDLPLVGDKSDSGDITYAPDASTDYVIQYFFTRAFGVQLPSVLDASETIADSLAT